MSPQKLSPEANLTGCGDSSAAPKVVSNNGNRKRLNRRCPVPSSRKFNARAPSEHSAKELIQAALQELEQKEIIKKASTPERKRSISMSDISLPKPHRRPRRYSDAAKVTDNTEKQNNITSKKIARKVLSTLYYTLWRKNKQQNVELKQQIEQYLIKGKFLKQLLEKECKERDNLGKELEIQRRNNAALLEEKNAIKKEKESTVKSLLETEKQFRATLLDAEKFEYFSNKYKKENFAYLEHIDKVSQELHKLRSENKEQKSKIVYLNTVADQQEENLLHINNIAEDLDTRLKSKEDKIRESLRKRDEALENEKLATYKYEAIEYKIKELNDAQHKLQLENIKLEQLYYDAENKKLRSVMECGELVGKLKECQYKLQCAEEENAKLRENLKIGFKNILLTCKTFCRNVPWRMVMFHAGIVFFPLVSRSVEITNVFD